MTDFWDRPRPEGPRYRLALRRTARQALVWAGICILFAVALALVR